MKKYPFIYDNFISLINDLKINGPYLYRWSHFGILSDGRFHCHLKGGHPTMVAIWIIISKKEHKMEIVNVDTHENANY